MKILKIAGLNLNSLRGAFEVDFEKPPLRGAGLFAITGPTGAGKSTLLDAITLALYGRAARYGQEANPENVMSRHCGDCSAEVTFEVPKGRYRAAWHLHRARDKADGKIQPPRRYVYDTNDAVLADSVRAAEELVAQLTGLDYERFLRSVLLAQGEFARFLKAKDNERAELLESLTGTGVYSELGRLAFEEHGRRQEAITAAELVLGAIELLPEAGRAEMEARREAAEGEHRKATAELATLQGQVDLAARLADARAQQATARAGIESAVKKQQAAADDLARLDLHGRTQPYTEDLAHLQSATEQSAEAEKAVVAAEGEMSASVDRHAVAVLAAALQGERLCELAARDLATAREAESRLKAQLTAKDRWLADHARDRGLSDELAGLVGGLADLAGRRRSEAAARERCQGLILERERLDATLRDLQAAVAWHEAECAARTTEAEQGAARLASILAGKTIEELESQRDAADRRVNEFNALNEQEKAIEDRRAALAEQAARHGDALRAAETAREQLRSAKELMASAKAKAMAADAVLQAVRLAASMAVHRGSLRPGEPCPLCGAPDHPWAERQETSAELQQAEAEAAAATKARASAEEAGVECEKLVASLSTKVEELQKLVARQEREIGDAEQAQATALAKAGIAAQAKLADVVAEAATLAGVMRIRLKDSREAEMALRRHEALLQQANNDLAIQRSKREDAQRNLGKTVELLAEAETRHGAAARDAAEARAGMEPRLAAFDVPVPEVGAEDAARDGLEARHRAYGEAERGRAKLAGLLAEESVRVRQAQEAQRSLGAQFAQVILDQEALPPQYDNRLLPQARAVASARKDGSEGLRAVSDASQARATSAGLLDEHRRRASRAKADLAAKERALVAQLAGSPFPSVSALKEARLREEEVGRIGRLKSELEVARQRAEGSLAACTAEADKWTKAGAVEGEAATALQARHAELRAATQDWLAKTIGLAKDLESDAENRARHAGKMAELEGLRSELVVWSRLKGLIGSRDGAVFRRYAQGLSLDVLVGNANLHLARLSDRYQLRRVKDGELGLEIVDLYQASAARPMESLSGGETFLASLALALGLSDLAGRNVRIDSLFIDEGFGALDADTLDVAISALETMQQDRKTVGVISHVDVLKERIAVKIVVEKRHAGTSEVSVVG